MSFVSHAQNFEDVMLWRALQDVGAGFYIDVGANHPLVDSVTHAFYERGWHGINVEPMQQYHDLLVARRPRDVNLAVAVGDQPGQLTFFEVPGTGLSTADPAIAQQYREAGRPVVEREVELVTLAAICREHAPGPVHFLKVDVEGLEAAVLRGMDFTACQPWIVVIEATRPMTQVAAHDDWQHILLQAGYRFAYFDGLNQFYVAPGHDELMAAFAAPPNFFDNFILRLGHHYSHPTAEFERWARKAARTAEVASAAAERRAMSAEQRAGAAEHRATLAEQRAVAAEQRAIDVQAQAGEMLAMQHQVVQLLEKLHAMQQSSSWRVTRPLRWVGEQRAAIRQHGFSGWLRGRGARAPAPPSAASVPTPGPEADGPEPPPSTMTGAALQAHHELLRAMAARSEAAGRKE